MPAGWEEGRKSQKVYYTRIPKRYPLNEELDTKSGKMWTADRRDAITSKVVFGCRVISKQ